MYVWMGCLLLGLIAFPASAQWGVNVRYLNGNAEILDRENISQDGMHASLEYHFRLSEKRLEFHPGAGYRFSFPSSEKDGNIKAWDVDLAASVYPFDFGGDCDCPTFSKEGNLVKKGFFLELIPGMSYQLLSRLRSQPDDPSRLPIKSKNFVFKMGGAAGLDIGLTENYTLTPLISATWLSASEWDGLLSDGSSATLDDQMNLGFGLRISYAKEERRRRRN